MASGLFVVMLLAANLMGVLRYIFRWGHPYTSPGYTLVPSGYFLFWDVLIAGMIGILLVKTKKISLTISALYLFGSVILLINYSQADNFYVLGAARSLLMYGFVFCCICSSGEWISLSHINKLMGFLCIFGVLFLLYQVYGYYCCSIYPAHSHEKLVRYGSFFDDSLVLAILLPMFAGYYFGKYFSSYSTMVGAVIFFSISVLTGSLTGMGGYAIYLLFRFGRKPKILVCFFSLLFFLAIQFDSYIADLWNFKLDSIRGHIVGWAALSNIELINIIGISPLNIFAESGLLLILYNFGLPILIILLIRTHKNIHVT